MLEWQSEASNLTLRVRGKQWYWVYKLDLKDFFYINNNNLFTNKISKNQVLNSGQVNSNIYKYFFKKNIYKWNNLVLKRGLDFGIGVDASGFFNTFFIKQNSKINKVFFHTVSSINYRDFFYKILNFNNQKNIYYKVNFFSNRSSLIKKNIIFNKNLNLDFSGRIIKKLNTKRHFVLIQMKNDFWVKKYNNSYENVLNYKNFSNASDFNNSRLLKTNKILVLPANFFINVITNSFDVIHSWFIPGLGFKMDCVPGRSTHHTLYIDTPGFYYGQCAEICGRLHHHMPIKICFLDYEHFYIWYLHTLSSWRLNNKLNF